MKYTIRTSKSFEKDLKRCEKRGYNLQTGTHSDLY